MTNEHEEQLGQLRMEVREQEAEWRQELKMIRENHLTHMQDSLTKIQIHMTQTSADLAWLVRFFWLIAGTMVANILVELAK